MILLTAGFFIGKAKLKSFPAMPEALQALRSNDNATVSEEKLSEALLNPTCYVFKPNNIKPAKGFIFYPGGLVDPRAYAPPARAIAAQGYLVVIVGMPFDLAPLGAGRAAKIIQRYGEIKKWAIGGHSVGGTFACKFVKDFPDAVDGIIIWASYPSERFRIDNRDVKAICIYGTHNPNCNADEIAANKPFLPPKTVYLEIEGANHTQFGYYDTSPSPVQPGDGIATITREAQQAVIIKSTVDFLDKL